jgi:hypothetical protein
MDWVIEATKVRDDGKVEIALAFAPGEITRNFGYDAFQLRFRVTVGSELELELETRNDAQEPLISGGFGQYQSLLAVIIRFRNHHLLLLRYCGGLSHRYPLFEGHFAGRN